MITSWQFIRRRSNAFILSVIAAAGTAHAQKAVESSEKPPVVSVRPAPKLRNLLIRLDGCLDVPDHDVFVVLNDDDLHQRRLEQHGSTWTTSVPAPGIDPTISHASVRYGTARTDCRKARADWKERVAVFEFTACEGPVQRLMITTKPSIHFSYVRELVSGQDASSPCKERGAVFDHGRLDSLQYRMEKLRLDLGMRNANAHSIGLLLLSRDTTRPGLLDFSPESANPQLFVTAKKMRRRVTKIQDGLRLDREVIVDAFINSDKIRMNSSAIAAYQATLGNLKTLDVTTVK